MKAFSSVFLGSWSSRLYFLSARRSEQRRGVLFVNLILVACLALPTLIHADSTLALLDDASLGEVSAQQGIAFDLEYRVNALANGDAVSASECPAIGALTAGASCRIAYSLADSSGMWIVAKAYRGMIKLTNIRIDAAELAAAWTSRTSGSLTGTGGQAAYMNPNLCINTSGCTSASPASSYYDPRSKPSLQLTAGNWATAKDDDASVYFTYLNQPNYSDFITSLYVEKLTAEFDTGCTTSSVSGLTTCTTRDGYLKDLIPGAPIALRLASGSSNAPAKVRLDGRLQIYGFGY